MKKFIVFIITAIILAVSTSFTVCGQDRVNGEVYSFSEKSNVATEFVGWYYNRKTEQWVGNNNCIAYEEMHFNGNEVRGNKYRNIQGVQAKTFEYNGDVFYVLDVFRNGGVYKYPSIREDWIPMKEHDYFILTKSQYESIVEPSDDVLEVYSACVETIESRENQIIRELIRYKDKFNSSDDDFLKKMYGKQLVIKKYNDSVRFLVNDSYGEWLALAGWSSDIIGWEPLNTLSKVYFETTIDEWEKIKL